MQEMSLLHQGHFEGGKKKQPYWLLFYSDLHQTLNKPPQDDSHHPLKRLGEDSKYTYKHTHTVVGGGGR